MARIPEQEMERLKGEVSLVRLVESKGIALRKHGAVDLIGLCPFHDDREPSLVVTPSKNLWHCLGACGTGGTVIDWVMRSEGVSFRHAVELLRSDASLSSSMPKSKTGRWRGEAVDGGKASVGGRSRGGGGCGPDAAGAGGDVLPRDAPRQPGGARVPRAAWPFESGCRAPLPSGLREPDAGVHASEEEPKDGGGDPRPSRVRSASCATAATSTSTGRW